MKFFFVTVFSFIGVLSLSTPAYGAALFFESDSELVSVGDTVTIDVLLNTENQVLNAFETRLTYDASKLAFIESHDGKSVLSFFVQAPEVTQEGNIRFSGITPGGFKSTSAQLLSLSFKVLKEGEGIVSATSAQALLHDGLGTPSVLTISPHTVNVVPGSSTLPSQGQTMDDEPPETFGVEVVTDPDVFKGDWFLVFATKDKGSGMSHFEVKEGFLYPYKEAQSPYQLKNQNLDTKISVKAVDREGNEVITELYPQHWKPWHQKRPIIATILISCVLLLLFSVLRGRGLRKR